MRNLITLLFISLALVFIGGMVVSKGPEETMTFPPKNESFTFAMEEGVVIDGVNIKSKYIKGKPHLTSRKPYYTASTLVNTQLLPKKIQELLGRSIHVYGSNGVCVTKINGFKVVVKEIPSDGTQQQWKDEETPEAVIAEAVFSEGIQHLVGSIEKCSGDFAKDARLPQSPIAVGQKVDREMEKIVWSAFRAMPLYKKAIKPFGKDINLVNLRKFVLPLKWNTSTYVTISVSAGNPLCGEEGETLGALWELVTTPKGHKLKEIIYLEDQILDYGTDIDNDGIPDFHYVSQYRDNSISFGFVRGDQKKSIDNRFGEAAFYHSPC